jgi:hypothetical protein
MDTQAVGSEAGKLSGHDVRRVMLHVVQMGIGTGLTVLAVNLGPKVVEAADRHNSLIAKLEGAIDRLEEQHQMTQRDIKELHQSCANWKPKT